MSQAPAVARYVVGYCFNPTFSMVALIEKLKPAWQRGKLNGVGGKIEPGETPIDAMRREFAEEAGPRIDRWLHIRTELFLPWQESTRDQQTGAKVYHFACRATQSEWDAVQTQEAERIFKIDYPLHAPRGGDLIYNLHYLIPMAAVLLQQPVQNRPQP